jgi:putative endonuclease
MPKDARVALGKLGEDLACEELQRRGYRILDRRFRTRCGELDIIARDGAVLVFVEVRARSGGSFGTPFDSVTWQKRRRLCRMAAAYLCQKRLPDIACRFDVVGVTGAAAGPLNIEVVKNAFEFHG